MTACVGVNNLRQTFSKIASQNRGEIIKNEEIHSTALTKDVSNDVTLCDRVALKLGAKELVLLQQPFPGSQLETYCGISTLTYPYKQKVSV